MPYGITRAWPFTKMVEMGVDVDVGLLTGLALHAPTFWPVAAFRSVASFGPFGTGTPLGPGQPAGGCTQVEDMEAGMDSSGTWGSLN